MASLKALLSALTLLALTVDASSGREYFICLSVMFVEHSFNKPPVSFCQPGTATTTTTGPVRT